MAETSDSKLIRKLRNDRLSLDELCEEFSLSEVEVKEALDKLKVNGLPVHISQSKKGDLLYHINVLPEIGNVFSISGPSKARKNMKIGLTSDWHFASKYHLSKTWHEAMSILEDRGVTHVYVAGDLLDGIKIYKGHLENITAFSIEDQTDIAAEALNRHPNIQFKGIAGNHDYSFTQQVGAKPMAVLETKADNFQNLGDFRADHIYDGIRFRLLHGASGRAYARTYPAQTYNRDFFSGLEKSDLKDVPDVMLLGHYHTALMFKDHTMWVVQPGSFQDGDNEYCIRRGLTGPAGLFVADITHQHGKILEFSTTYITPKAAEKEKGAMHARNTRRYR